MHVFLLDIPRLEFAAIIPKGEYATVCLLGSGIDQEMVDSFFRCPRYEAVSLPSGLPKAHIAIASPRSPSAGRRVPTATVS